MFITQQTRKTSTMASTQCKKDGKKTIAGQEFIESVFSWTIPDVFNTNLYKNKVQAIPKTFPSSGVYRDSFVPPLLEETRSELCSKLETVSAAPWWRIAKIEEHKDFKLPKNLFYKMVLQEKKSYNFDRVEELQFGALVAITDVKPDSIKDLNRPNFPYLIAVITQSDYGFISIISSRLIGVGERSRKELFALGLSNLTTNLRIWKALQPSRSSMALVEKVLTGASMDNDNCPTCSLDDSFCYSFSNDISVPELNPSQEQAVKSCIARSKCRHGASLKLIWGPPGTGKTKTVACLLNFLLKQRCRTVLCAPTNIAVIEVAKRLQKSIVGDYGLGDILLFGNKNRMNINDHDDCLDIFLDYRIEVLERILNPSNGWSRTLQLIISLLENPEEHYDAYIVNKNREERLDRPKDKDNKGTGEFGFLDFITARLKLETILSPAIAVIAFVLGKSEESEQKLRSKTREERLDSSKDRENKGKGGLKFLEFINGRLKPAGDRFMLYLIQLCRFMPTSTLSLEQAKSFMEAHEHLKIFLAFLHKQKEDGRTSSDTKALALNAVWVSCLRRLKQLPSELLLARGNRSLREFYFEEACLLFGTASGTERLRDVKTPIEMLVIDEAAQLKECESTIPLQLPGLRHAVLVGDENQLHAMVQSEINKKAGFGRSLFERLVSLGYKKHLLNVQYRMHPSISSFPNHSFYNNLISNGSNVQQMSYKKQFLKGDIFGPYSFINIGVGIEQREFNSIRNTIEVAAIENILERLSKAAESRKEKLTVGIISPYKAQVKAILDRIQRFNSFGCGEMSLNVKSVDGFQGGEEDIILFSTVRSNATGNIGFLSDQPRTNVAITRARHCAWILGNGSTLEKSGSVWAKLLKDAKRRRCYHNAEDDKKLSIAISISLMENGQITLAKSVFLKAAPWKVIFCDDFCLSLKEAERFGACQEALSWLQKLAFCWRPSESITRLCTSSVICEKMVKQIRISNQFTLIWSIDIEKENCHETQVIKFWGIKRFEEVPDLVNKLEMVYGDYSIQKVRQCQYQQKEGNLVLPKQWSADVKASSFEKEFTEGGEELTHGIEPKAKQKRRQTRRTGKSAKSVDVTYAKVP